MFYLFRLKKKQLDNVQAQYKIRRRKSYNSITGLNKYFPAIKCHQKSSLGLIKNATQKQIFYFNLLSSRAASISRFQALNPDGHCEIPPPAHTHLRFLVSLFYRLIKRQTREAGRVRIGFSSGYIENLGLSVQLKVVFNITRVGDGVDAQRIAGYLKVTVS